MGHTVVDGNMDHLIRSEIWSTYLKETLQDDLFATQFVNWLTEFPDGDQFTIPSIGQMPVRDYSEDEAVVYDQMDTGEFTFTIDEYLSSATYITKKAKQDSFYMNQLVSRFVPEQARAIAEHVEEKIWGLQSQQTASDLNNINGAAHRYVAGGTNDEMVIDDIIKAKYALDKANVPSAGRVAIVSPETEYEINAILNTTYNTSSNPHFEGMVNTGIGKDNKFIKHIYGFDFYVSNRLADISSETINSDTVTNGKACLFFNADSSISPFVGAWRQMPEVDSEYNKDFQREEYVTTARYGAKLYRPENLVTVLVAGSI